MLSRLALDTGGVPWYRPAAFDAPFARIQRETSAYYVLLVDAGEPADRARPRRFEVRVSRPGVQVRARGVVAASVPRPLGAWFDALDHVPPPLRAALAEPLPVTGVGLKGTASLVWDATAGRARAVLNVDTDVSSFDPTHDSPLQVAAVAVDLSGRPRAFETRSVVLSSAFPADAPLRERGVRLCLTVPVDEGTVEIRVAAGWPAAGRVGSIHLPVDVPAFARQPLTLSGIMLSEQGATATPAVGSDPVIQDALRGPVTLNRTFGSETVLTWLVELYEATAAHPVQVAATVSDAGGHEMWRHAVTVEGAPIGPRGARSVTGRVDLRTLATGRYVLRVEAAIPGAGTSATATRTVPFDIAAPATPSPGQDGTATSPRPGDAIVSPRTPSPPAVAGRPPALSRGTPPGAHAGERVDPDAVPTDIAGVMARAGRYVGEYGEQMSLVIGTERYVQWMQGDDFLRPVTRVLVSEFALVRVQDDWLGLRDVYEVEGRTVGDRKGRLLALLRDPTPDSMDEGRRIADESARYNLGAIQRNFNVPTTALLFLQPGNQPRFRFTKDGEERLDGRAVWRVRYQETRRPTIIRTSRNRDMPVAGMAWIDPADGVVLKTSLLIRVDGRLGGQGNLSSNPSGFGDVVRNPRPGDADPVFGGARTVDSTASVTVSYRWDSRLGLFVPGEMAEEYQGPAMSQFTGREAAVRIRCQASYSDFRRFETTARVVVPK